MLDLTTYALKSYNDGLQRLNTMLEDMVGDAMAIQQLVQADLQLETPPAQHVHEGNPAKQIDRDMNRLEGDIIQLAQEVISKFAPMGDSLRFMIGSIKLSTLLELIGDRAKNTYKRLHKMNAAPDAEVRQLLGQMVETNHALLQSARALIVDYSEDHAKTMVEKFRNIEGLYKKVWPQKTLNDADYHNIIMVAKNQQHIADMLVDIKRILYFVHTGKTAESKLA